MNKLTLAKCSNILKDPYNNKSRNLFYLFKNKILTFMSTKNFENYFLDFNTYNFSTFAKQIFDEVGYGLRTGNLDLFARNLNENVYFALRDEKLDYKNTTEDFLVKCFPLKTEKWEIVHARTLFLSDLDFSQAYAQITMKYSTEEKEDNYIIFERTVVNNMCFYHWKIFVLNYQYYKK